MSKGQGGWQACQGDWVADGVHTRVAWGIAPEQVSNAGQGCKASGSSLLAALGMACAGACRWGPAQQLLTLAHMLGPSLSHS